ncbi:MAG: SDR family oxidoreductase [Xanthobacteraceae bacterium]
MSETPQGWVVVSGAAGALGRLIAQRYASQGRRVLALDRAVDALAEIASTDGVATSAVDLADAEAVHAALEAAIPKREPIALLVNAVGLIWNEPVIALKGARFAAHGVESFERVIRANLTAPFVAASAVAARMARTGGGAIVNFSSISAAGNVGQAAYGAAKAGVEGMTRAMARELGPLGVRVNAVAPGFIDVASTRAALTDPVLADYARRTPVGRLGAADELMEAIESLASNKFLNGVILPLDGGLRL